MKGKKLLSILLASAMLTGALAGCGGSDAPAAPESQQKEEQTDTAKEEAPAQEETSSDDAQELPPAA